MFQHLDVYFQLHYIIKVAMCLLLESILCLFLLKQAPPFYLPGNDDKRNDIKSGDLHHLLSFSFSHLTSFTQFSISYLHLTSLRTYYWVT